MTDKTPSYTPLNDSKFHEWSFFTEAILVCKDLMDIIDGTITCPLSSPNHKSVKAFIQKQKLACAKIILHVEPSLLPHCCDPDPKVIWDNLRALHQSWGFASHLSLHRCLITMKKEELRSMQSWVAAIHCVAFQLEEIQVNIPDKDIILVLTTGLPSSYEVLIVSLDLLPPDSLTIDNIVSHLLNEEAQQADLDNDSNSPTNAAMSTACCKTPLLQITCFRSQEKGHYQSHCPEKPDDNLIATSTLTINEAF